MELNFEFVPLRHRFEFRCLLALKSIESFVIKIIQGVTLSPLPGWLQIFFRFVIICSPFAGSSLFSYNNNEYSIRSRCNLDCLQKTTNSCFFGRYLLMTSCVRRRMKRDVKSLNSLALCSPNSKTQSEAFGCCEASIGVS